MAKSKLSIFRRMLRLKQLVVISLLMFQSTYTVYAQTGEGHIIFLPLIANNDVAVDDRADLPKDETICGRTDDRALVVDRRVGRIGWQELGVEKANCTVYLVSNGSVLTAGHCADSLKTPDAFVEFNVPLSNVNGTIVRSAPNDRYEVRQESIISSANGTGGGDWTIFRVERNANTQLTPFEAQSHFFRMTQRMPNGNETIRITGNGVDTGAANQTTQTHTGPNIPSSKRDTLYYRVDTRGGNSGSPIIWDAIGYAIGIHTNGGCTATGDENSGTSFNQAELANALENLHGTGTIHVDQMQLPGNSEDGTVFRPFNTIVEAIDSVSSGNTVSIVAGVYSESFTRSKAVRLIAPAGPVTLKGPIVLGSAAP